MAKGSKADGPNASAVANRDILQRLNFLYQAGTFLSQYQHDSKCATMSPGQEHKSSLARMYVSNMRAIGKKAIVKMDPSVKRTLCRGCDALLIPGRSMTVRVKSSRAHGKVVNYTCIGCRTSFKIPAPPEGAETLQSLPTNTSIRRLRRQKTRQPPLFARLEEHVILCGDQPVIPHSSN